MDSTPNNNSSITLVRMGIIALATVVLVAFGYLLGAASQQRLADASPATQAQVASKCADPGSFASHSMVDAYSACLAEQRLHDRLVQVDGVLEAQVLVSLRDSKSLTGPATIPQVDARIYLAPGSTFDSAAMTALVRKQLPAATADTIHFDVVSKTGG
jgi:hypothetical protein